MKRKIFSLKSVILTALCLVIMFLISGCGETEIQVESMMKLENDFSGERAIVCSFGDEYVNNEAKSQQLESIIKDSCPKEMSYTQEKTDNLDKYTFTIKFKSLADYKSKINNILGREVSVVLSTPNSELAKGWSYSEDFDCLELLNWFKNEVTDKGYKDLKINLKSLSNVVNYKGDLANSESSVLYVNNVQGYPVNAVSIETVNNKDDSYDRTLSLSVPQSSYDKMGSKLINIMKERTDQLAAYSGWSQQGNNQVYQVMYKNINLKNLIRVTNLFLDCTGGDVYYGDENNSSTPLAEQLVFEENINLLSFISKEDKSVSLSYKYSLPMKTTYGQGVVFNNGTWNKQGDWIDGVYTLNSEDKVYDIRIPDGMQYTIKGINVNLITYDNDSFLRTFDFLYDSNSGVEGMNYAYDFLKAKGLNVSKDATGEDLVCRITSKGTAKEISSELGNLFGGGNYFSYNRTTSTMAVVTDITVDDSINIGYMLTGENSEVPFNYTVESQGNENINRLNGENNTSKESPKITSLSENSFKAELTGGDNIITYSSTVPYVNGVVIYCIISVGLLILAFALISFFFNKTRKLNQKEKAEAMAKQRQAMEKPTPSLPEKNNYLF